MLAYVYTLTNQYTGESIEINSALDNGGNCQTIDGFPTGLRLTNYPVFELDVRGQEEDKVGQHGIFDFFSFYGKRKVEFEGVIYAQSHDELVQIQERLRRIVSLPAQPIINVNDGYNILSWTDALGMSWYIEVKIEEDVKFSREVAVQTESSFYLSMKADNPQIYSLNENNQNQLLGWRQSQFMIQAFLSNNFDFRFNNMLNVYQAGTGDAPWRAKLYGPADNPKITKFLEQISNETILSSFSSGWVGGQEEKLIFQTQGIARKLTSLSAVQDTMTLTQAFDLTSAKFITFYLYIDDINNMAPGDYLTGQNYIKFIESAGVDEFVIEFYEGNPTLRSGWNYFFILKDEFEVIGNPSWNDITAIELSIKADTGKNLEVIFDDLRLRDITYLESKLEILTSIGAGEYIEINIADGTVLKNGNQDVSGLVSFDSDFYSLLPKQNILLYESDESPQLSWVYPTQPVEFAWNDVIL